MWFRAFHLVLLALCVQSSRAKWTVECPNAGDKRNLQEAIKEASKVAANARTLISEKWHESWVQTPPIQFFVIKEEGPDDRQELLARYQKVQDIEESDQVVTFFCDEEHISWNPNWKSWADNKFTYNSNGQKKAVPLNTRVGNPLKKPGEQNGGSYTVLGYKIPVENNGLADCTNQAHVFIHKKRISPPSGVEDNRDFDSIVLDGLLPEFLHIDKIKPLAATVLHELIHVVGGLEDEQGLSGSGKVSDGPNDDMYGASKCFKAHCDHVEGRGRPPLEFADPHVIVAKELYLQTLNKKKNTNNEPIYWFTGAVESADQPWKPQMVLASRSISSRYSRSSINSRNPYNLPGLKKTCTKK